MVPVPSACTVDGKPLADLLPADEIDALVSGPATAAPRSSAC